MPKIMAGNLADHRQLVRGSLLDALDELLDEREYDRITLTDVAARAGVARNTIYNYAPDKASLLLAAVRRSTDQIEQQVEALAQACHLSAAERLTNVIAFLLTSFTKGTHRVFVLQAQVGSLEVKDQAIAVDSINAVQSHITLVLEQGVRTGEFRASSSASLELAFISGVMAAAVRQMALDPARTAQAVSEATAFILRAVQT
ncbi:TetR/AcrR family transcriptional regulator [Herbiconiux ginsengi]|uniref:Transcriptional regulator, TetR family n=1 Tax=Herbiconiux ginsengi TaxID=381665 RepID=A0A1H3TE24_9MICO|nr:TetR/AcrR family transcriptional regulator [Herbiconiux ginsengi]SDZ48081.1 transcriptional regulator, TetR family [Herbiconiux ginsengi]